MAKGLYGSIIIEDNKGYEQGLRGGVIPSADQTKTLVLSDITVCKAAGYNPATYADGLPHVSGIDSTGLNKWQINYSNHDLTQSPSILCEDYPLNANGVYTPYLYGAGDVPNIQSPSLTGRMSEGFTVLTNGVNVGGRSLTIDESGVWTVGDLDSDAKTLDVKAGQGLRLQIVNPSPVRYMRLRLTAGSGAGTTQINLVRIGGQGGCSTTRLWRGHCEWFRYEIWAGRNSGSARRSCGCGGGNSAGRLGRAHPLAAGLSASARHMVVDSDGAGDASERD